MRRRLSAVAGSLALAATALAGGSSRLRADLVIPSDFGVLREYAFSRCEQYGFVDVTQPQPYPIDYVTSCVQGLAAFGLNTTTNLYGLTYDFWTTLSAPPPGNASVQAWMCGISIDGYTGTGSPTYVTVGGIAAVTCPGSTSLTNGIAYSPIWASTSSIIGTSAFFLGHQDSRFQDVADDRWGGVAVTTIPEPSSFALLGAGLMAFIGARRVRQRGARRSSCLAPMNAVSPKLAS